jgi:hypothetical protein
LRYRPGRHAFKKDSKNKGKVDSTAAFSVVRHPNYAGYLLWRTGASLISVSTPLFCTWLVSASNTHADSSVLLSISQGSAYVAVGTFAVNFLSFALQAIPGLDGYMSTRYGKQYSVRFPFKRFIRPLRRADLASRFAVLSRRPRIYRSTRTKSRTSSFLTSTSLLMRLPAQSLCSTSILPFAPVSYAAFALIVIRSNTTTPR